jgi:multiple sugar transport system ATP-binding protein
LILADLIAVMDQGRIVQVGTPREIYDTPNNLFVAGFLNLHVGAPPLSLLPAPRMPGGERFGDAWVGVRPEDVDMSRERGEGLLSGLVTDIQSFALGHSTQVTIRVGEHEVHALLTRAAPPEIGDEVSLSFRRYHLFERETGRRLMSHGSGA